MKVKRSCQNKKSRWICHFI